jgi:hypothetical protein
MGEQRNLEVEDEDEAEDEGAGERERKTKMELTVAICTSRPDQTRPDFPERAFFLSLLLLALGFLAGQAWVVYSCLST